MGPNDQPLNISKRSWVPDTLLSPVPAVMVTCKNNEGKDNIQQGDQIGRFGFSVKNQ